MAVTLKALADGQLPATKGTLYTVPGATQAAVKVTLVNTDTAARTVNLYLQRTGTSRRIAPKTLSLGIGEKYTTGIHTLEAGDLVEGDASVAAVVDYVVDGFEVT